MELEQNLVDRIRRRLDGVQSAFQDFEKVTSQRGGRLRPIDPSSDRLQAGLKLLQM